MDVFCVEKFGGSSLSSAKKMRHIAKLFAKRKQACLIVLSAVEGATNSLQLLTQESISSCKESINQSLEDFFNKHRQIALDLCASEETLLTMESLFKEIFTLIEGMRLLKESSLRSIDRLLSFGEFLSTLLFMEALKSENIPAQKFDSREVMKTDNTFGQAKPLRKEIRSHTQKKLLPLLSHKQYLVCQGFIGSTEDGDTTTLGRGGSDYSASLFAEALSAKKLFIWTDVPGILSCDPRMIPKSHTIPEISFVEATELATFGAKVLHPATLSPAIRNQIPVFVGSTFHRERKGTWIKKHVNNLPVIRAIAVRRNQTLLIATNVEMFQACGFLAKLFSLLAKHHISVDLVTTSEVSVSVTLDNPSHLTRESIRDLKKIADITIEKHFSLVAVIGNRLTLTKGMAKKIFESINKYNIRLICHGSSENNICFLVDEKEVCEVVKHLHYQLFNNNNHSKKTSMKESHEIFMA